MRVPRQAAYHRPTTAPPPPRRPAARPDPPGAAGRGPHRAWARWVALAAAATVLAVAAAGWAVLRRVGDTVAADLATAAELARHDRERPPPGPGAARTLLVIGTEDRGARAAALLLLRLPAGTAGTDGASAAAVAVPPGLRVDVPACTGRDGTPRRAARASLAHAYATGGTACLIRTLERLTWLRVDVHATMPVPTGSGVCAFHRSEAAPPELRAVPPERLRVLDVPADDDGARTLLTRLRAGIPAAGEPVCAG
ncbi:hypothetical protein [Streptomyces sp. URMC 129]|uniref:hypothetical protein n=1 Tax=Streptomyces sp. URMC 129 TaxID=3423407 RepID=UPI003F1D0013